MFVLYVVIIEYWDVDEDGFLVNVVDISYDI